MPKPPLTMKQLRRITVAARVLNKVKRAGLSGSVIGLGATILARGPQPGPGEPWPPELSPGRKTARNIFAATGAVSAVAGYGAHRARRALLKFATRRMSGR